MYHYVPTTKYRPDIDGLRAFAVLSVLFFHLGFESFTGGYIGVDVFFVISGFLITRLIKEEVEAGHFSFQTFYIRRFRRLFPALFFTLIVCIIIACFLLSPLHLKAFSGSFLSTLSSLSNIFFWEQSSYFDTDAHFKPLLHTWSLSVEEQFYLIWPFLLALLLKRTRQSTTLMVLLTIGCLSLIANYLCSHDLVHFSFLKVFLANKMSTIFYLAPFRIYEFIIGAVLVWLITYQPRNKLILEFIMVAGFMLLIYPVIRYTDKNMVFSSYRMVVPAVGAALLIYSGTAKYVGKILNNPLAVGIGLISYSLYLIHWPIYVFYHYYVFDDLSISEKWMLIIISLIAAGLMYQFIEQKFRKKTITPSSSLKIIQFTSLPLAVILVFICFNIWINQGWEWRNVEVVTGAHVEQLTQRQKERYNESNSCLAEEFYTSSHCKRDAKKQILIIGDSHELAWSLVFQKYFGENPDINLIRFSYYKCDIGFNDQKFSDPIDARNDHCDEKANLLNDSHFIASLSGVILASYRPYQYESNNFRFKIIKEIEKGNKNIPILVLGTYLNTKFPCLDIVNRRSDLNACKQPNYVEYIGKETDVKKEIYFQKLSQIPHVYLDVFQLLCKGSLTNCPVSSKHMPMMLDKNHLTPEFVDQVLKKIILEKPDVLTKVGLDLSRKRKSILKT